MELTVTSGNAALLYLSGVQDVHILMQLYSGINLEIQRQTRSQTGTHTES